MKHDSNRARRALVPILSNAGPILAKVVSTIGPSKVHVLLLLLGQMKIDQVVVVNRNTVQTQLKNFYGLLNGPSLLVFHFVHLYILPAIVSVSREVVSKI